jgi:hypothetical protein
MSGDGEESLTVCHDNMFSLSSDPKTRFLERSDRLLMVDAGKFGHKLKSNFPCLGACGFPQDIFSGGKIFPDCILDVFHGFVFGITLRPTTRKIKTVYGVTFVGFL